MNSLTRAVLAFSLIAAPALSFAQDAQAPVTRAEVQAELVQLEHAGYYPSRINDTTFPADLQAAEAKVQAQNATATGSTTAQSQHQALATMPLAMTGKPHIDEPRDPFYYGA